MLGILRRRRRHTPAPAELAQAEPMRHQVRWVAADVSWNTSTMAVRAIRDRLLADVEAGR